jgi:predicted Zn-dependent protease
MAESPAEMVERALAASRTQGCVAVVADTVQANLRWASSSLTTDGVAHERSMTVVALRGEDRDVSAGSITRTVRDPADVRRLVRDAETLAAQSPPEESARPLVAGAAAPDFADPPASGGVAVLAPLTQPLADVLARARSDALLLYGYAEHCLTTTYLGTSAGTRVRHVQPAGHLTMTAKTADLGASTWVGRATRDFSDLDVPALDDELRRRLAWSARTAPLAPGRHEVLLPPSAVADLMIYAYWTMAGIAAHEGRSVYAQPGHGTRVGQSLVDDRVTLSSDPHLPGLGCADVLVTSASSPMASVFDNGLPVGRTAWVDRGSLRALVQTRHSAELTGLPVTPFVGNLHLGVQGGAGDVDDLVARTDDGVLLTSLWYLREVDPATLLLTGLTRDGVHVVRGGEVIGTARNFRFNESPVDVLRRIRDAGASVPTFSREWGEYFDRTAMPPLRVADFHLSTVSDAL